MLEKNKFYTVRIKILKGSMFKIGVTKVKDNLDHAFCDYETGWGWYNYCAEKRHASKTGG